MIAVACLALLGALVAFVPPDPSPGFTARCGGRESPGGTRLPSWSGRLVLVAGVLLAVGLAAPGAIVWAVPAIALVGTVGWIAGNGHRERAREIAQDEVMRACQALAGQLRVGDVPARALAVVAADCEVLRPVAAAQAIGGDVAASLRAQARRPGCGGLAALARSWRLCELTGARVAEAATRVANSLRADMDAERRVAGELASARATGRLLAFLPALGLGLGFAGGGDPVAFLVGTMPGRVCLAAAVCLCCTGLIWTTVLARVPPLDEGACS